MKMQIKTLSTLTSDLRALIDQNFRFELDQPAMLKSIHEFMQDNMFTDSGKRRYSKTYQTALNAFWYEYTNIKQNENTIYCYEVNGKLYTTYDKLGKPFKYWFKGQTDIENYRIHSEIDDMVLCGKYERSGFYYGSGKPFFIREQL